MPYRLSRLAAATTPLLAPGELVIGGATAGTAWATDLPRRVEVAVTDRRLLVFARSRCTGRPSSLLLEIPLLAVERVETARYGVARGAIVTASDGRTLALDATTEATARHLATFVDTLSIACHGTVLELDEAQPAFAAA